MYFFKAVSVYKQSYYEFYKNNEKNKNFFKAKWIPSPTTRKFSFKNYKTRRALRFKKTLYNLHNRYPKKFTAFLKKLKKRVEFKWIKRKPFSYRFFFKKPICRLSTFIYFLVLKKVIFSNSKRFNDFQIARYLVSRARRFFFFTNFLFERSVKLLVKKVYLSCFKWSKRYRFFAGLAPSYKKSRFFKSNKLHKSLRFLINRQNNSNNNKLSYKKKIASLLFRSFRVKHQLYKKTLIKFYIQNTFQIKFAACLSKKVTFNLFNSSTLESRLDFVLIKLNLFSTLIASRSAILAGLVFLNFNRIKNINFLVNSEDLIFVTKIEKELFYLKQSPFRQSYFYSKVYFRRYFFFKNKVAYFKQKFLSLLFRFFKKILLIKSIKFKSLGFDFALYRTKSLSFFLEIFSLRTVNLNFIRKGFSSCFLNNKLIGLLAHMHF